MNQITIPLNGKTEISSGHTMFIAWEALLPAISELILLRPDEVIEGFILDEKGLI